MPIRRMARAEPPRRTGEASCGITPKPWWQLISWWRSRRASACCMSSWLWKLAVAAFCTVTSALIPTAAWTLQQFREAVPGDHSSRFLIHDRDSIFSTEVDEELQAFDLKVLRTRVQAPKANAYCERL